VYSSTQITELNIPWVWRSGGRHIRIRMS